LVELSTCLISIAVYVVLLQMGLGYLKSVLTATFIFCSISYPTFKLFPIVLFPLLTFRGWPLTKVFSLPNNGIGGVSEI